MLKKIKNNYKLYKNELHKKGITYFLSARIIKISDLINYNYSKIFGRNREFIFRNNTYHYKFYKYNYTWKNERIIEIPIIWELVKNSQNKKILEVGNVLSHYYSINHDVLDKYEKAKDVINEDVVSFKPHKKYNLIISISSLEHVGWDEKIKEPLKILRATENLKKLLDTHGQLLFTIPVGYYNPQLDSIIKENKFKSSAIFYMKRISKDNRWKEATWNEVKDAKYNTVYPHANAIAIVYIKV